MERENKFRVWDNEKNEYFKPIYEAYKGNLEEMLLSQSGELTLRTMTQFIHCPSIYPNRFEVEFSTGSQDTGNINIYKGDIVENTIIRKQFIIPKNAKSYYRNQKIKTTSVVIWDNWWNCFVFNKGHERGELRIIGNIHQNKDLL